MAVELRAASSFGIIAVPDINVLQPNRAVELVERVRKAFFAYDVISRNVRVAGINASARGHEAAQQIQQLCNLLEVATERKLRSGSILDQDAQIVRRQVEPVHCLLDGQGDTLQAFFPAASAKRARMQDQELGAKGKRPLHLAAKRRDGLGVELRIAAREIHQVVGVDDQGLQSIALAK